MIENKELRAAAQENSEKYQGKEKDLYEKAFIEGAIWSNKNNTRCSLKQQVGGNHYKNNAIQPVEYAHANKLDFLQGSVVKYVTRFRDKNGAEDLKKAAHFIQMLLDLEYPFRDSEKTGHQHSSLQ